MFGFSGQQHLTIDANGRLKLGVDTLRELQRLTQSDVVLFCLPEGAVGIYPPATWEAMRRADLDLNAAAALDNLAFRRKLRRFGALSVAVPLTPQGRITVPPAFREFAGVTVPGPVVVVGAGLGLELWDPARWQTELGSIDEHMVDRGTHEMAADLVRSTHARPGVEA